MIFKISKKHSFRGTALSKRTATLKSRAMLSLKYSLISSLLFCATAYASPLQTLQSLLSATHNYSANFIQTTREGRDGISRTATGKIYLQKPNRFRWELSAPSPQIIVSDGRYLWVYDPSLLQVTQKKVTSRTFDPALLLTGDSSKILHQFRVTWLPSFGGWYQLQPKHSGSGILVIRLQYRANQLSKIQVMNNMNQSSLFTFTQIKMNTTLPANLFNFTVPQGTTLLKQ
jgi:outer membrane lipoprotein carrier protein